MRYQITTLKALEKKPLALKQVVKLTYPDGMARPIITCPPNHCYINLAKERETIVGWAMALPRKHPNPRLPIPEADKDKCLIMVYVNQKYRRKKIATKLVKQLLSKSTSKNKTIGVYTPRMVKLVSKLKYKVELL